jgi:CPA2 family monovalent cation:H+ antiporter-2
MRLVCVLAAITTHDVPLIATIAVSVAFAFVGGLLAVRLRLPPLVGYLLAGIVVGPFTPGFVADAKLAPQLAEIGVILLMFGVGTHFSIRDLVAVRHVALPGAFTQIIVATALGAGVMTLWGWSLGAGIIFGLSLSVASTVVLLRALEDRDMIKSNDGRIAIGWLVVEDLLMVLTLVLLPALTGVLGGDLPNNSGSLWPALGITIGKVVLFIGLMLIAGVRFFPWLLSCVERTGSRELFTLAVIALALGVAFGSAKLFGVSFALGAFFCGSGRKRIRFESPRSKGSSAAPRCVHCFVFRCGGNAVRSFDPHPGTASGFGRARDCCIWKVVSRFRHCSSAGRLDADSTHCLGCARPDR